jgi:hypothetical protein
MSMRIRAAHLAGAAMLVAFFQSATAGTLLPPEVRIATTWRDVADVRLLAAAWFSRASSWTRASRIEIALGVVDGSGRARPFVSVGPVWRLNHPEAPAFVEIGFRPTALGGSSVGNEELGGNLHFTSSVAVGRDFDRGPLARIALRIQHLSNGGLRDRNPGLDLVGLNFVSRFGER